MANNDVKCSVTVCWFSETIFVPYYCTQCYLTKSLISALLPSWYSRIWHRTIWLNYKLYIHWSFIAWPLVKVLKYEPRAKQWIHIIGVVEVFFVSRYHSERWKTVLRSLSVLSCNFFPWATINSNSRMTYCLLFQFYRAELFSSLTGFNF